MSWTVFAANLLENAASVVSVSPAALTTNPITRIYDRGRTFQYIGGSAAQTDIDIFLRLVRPCSGLWLLCLYIASASSLAPAGSLTPRPTEAVSPPGPA